MSGKARGKSAARGGGKSRGRGRGGAPSARDRVPIKQKGTGIHLDVNAFNLWETQLNQTTWVPLERFRPFQSFVALTDSTSEKKVMDGGLEVIPGFHRVCENYFQTHEAGERGRAYHMSYSTKFDERLDSWIYPLIQKVQRIPEDWTAEGLPDVSGFGSKVTSELIEHCTKIANEHKKLKFVPVQEGDFVIWDIRMAHQNSEKNETEQIRSVFYHAYMLAQPEHINHKRISQYKKIRLTKAHPEDFNSKWADIEQDIPTAPLGTKLSSLLYNSSKWSDDTFAPNTEISNILERNMNALTDRHIAFFKRYGYVVIENAVDKDLTRALYEHAFAHAKKLGCDIRKGVSKAEWSNIGGNFGAMVEFFWQPQQESIRFNEKLYSITAKLFQNTWETDSELFHHPIEGVDGRKLWLYIDRMNIRLPETWTKEE